MGKKEGRKEMFYLNDAPNTFYLWLKGVGYKHKELGNFIYG